MKTKSSIMNFFLQPKTSKQIKDYRFVCIFFLMLSTIFLITLKSFVILIFDSAYLVFVVVYLSRIKKLERYTLYQSITIHVLLYLSLILSFNICLFSVPKLIGSYDLLLLIFVILLEVIALVIGFICSLVSEKKQSKRYKKVFVGASIVSSVAGACGYFFARYIISNESKLMQSVMFTMIFAVTCVFFALFFGMYCMYAIYYVKKHAIKDKEI